MSIPCQVHQTELKALEERLSCCQMAQNFVLMMLCILLNQAEIYSALRIYVIMIIILKPITKAVKNFFILLQ